MNLMSKCNICGRSTSFAFGCKECGRYHRVCADHIYSMKRNGMISIENVWGAPEFKVCANRERMVAAVLEGAL